MTSDKQLFQNFSDFRGLDVRSSDLNRPLNFAKEVLNFVIEKSFALGGEKGFKSFAAIEDKQIAGLHTYKFKDPTTGDEGEELLCIRSGADVISAFYSESGFCRLKEESFSITYSGSGTWGYEFLLDEDGTYHFKLYEDSVEVLDYSVGTGFEDDAMGRISLGDLEAQIDAVSGFAATSDATVDALVAATFPLVAVDGLSPSSVAFSVYRWETIPVGLTSPLIVGGYVNAYLEALKSGRKVQPPTFLNKNNCCYIALSGHFFLLKYDGAQVYRAGVRGFIDVDDVSIAAGTATGTPLVGSYRYYIRPGYRDAKGSFFYGRGFKSDVLTTAGGEAPFLGSFFQTRDARVFLGWSNANAASTNTVTFAAGWPFADEQELEDDGELSVRVGDVLFLTTGSIFQNGIPRRVSAINRAAGSITFEGDPFALTLNTSSVYWWGRAGFSGAGGSFHTSGVASSTLTGVPYGVAVGQWLLIPGQDKKWYQVTSVGAFSLTIDGLVNIATLSPVFCSSQFFQIYRTEDEGLEKFYLVDEVNDDIYEDNIADANLGEELILFLEESDYLRDNPESICEHQDIIITAGGTQRQGRLFFEDILSLEAFPLATNFYDVKSQDSGGITALWSDSFDQLAVFKDTAYYSVTGNFTDEIPLLQITKNTENDVGISSQASLLKIRGINIGIGPLGPVAFRAGEIDYEFTKQLDSEFLNNLTANLIPEEQKLRTERAIAVNDSFKQQAYFFVPAINVRDGKFCEANEYSKIFVYDYSERAWMRRGFETDLGEDFLSSMNWPNAGMALYQDRLFFASSGWDASLDGFTSALSRRKDGEVLPIGITDYRQDYADQHIAIDYRYKTQWLWLDTPSTDKLFHWLFIYSFPSADFVPFDLTVKTYLDFDEDTIIDNITLSFTSLTKFRSFKLNANKGKALLVEFSTNTILQKPTIIGYEVLPGDADLGLEGVR